MTYDMMHKLTLLTYLITSFLKNDSIKNNQKFSLHIPTRNSYLSPSFNIFQRSFLPKIPNTRPTYSLSKKFLGIIDQTL